MKMNWRCFKAVVAMWQRVLMVSLRLCASRKTSNSSKMRKGVYDKISDNARRASSAQGHQRTSKFSPKASKRQVVVKLRSPPLRRGENDWKPKRTTYSETYLSAFTSFV